MKVTSEEKIEIIIVLSETEARWLQAVMQNPLNGDPDSANEDPEEAINRIALFSALKDALQWRFSNER